MSVFIVATTTSDYVVNTNGKTGSFSVSATASASGDANDVSNVVDQASRTSQIQAFLISHQILAEYEVSQQLNNYLNTTGFQSTSTTTIVQTYSE